MEPLKKIYNKNSITSFANEVHLEFSGFKKDEFLKLVIAPSRKLEMKDRVRLISQSLYTCLNLPYPKAIKILTNTISPSRNTGFMVWPISQFIEDHGMNYFSASMRAIAVLTKEFTAEFCIRPFLIQHREKTFDQLEKWVGHKNHHLRRLVSEGTRPNLPWGVKIPNIENNLSRNIELLEKLKNDPSEYVRKSVANHLNDISRIDRKLFVHTIKRFKSDSEESQKLIRHASRTLLKKGDSEILKIHGYAPHQKIEVKLSLRSKRVQIGNSLPIQVVINNQSKTKEKELLIDYVIDFLRKDGSHSQKVFRLKDINLKPLASMTIDKKISFKPVTTRKQYCGKHFLSIQINGKIFEKKEFELTQGKK